MLKIGLDLRATEADFKAHFGRGTGRYALELSRTLLKQSDCLIAPLTREIVGGSRFERALVNAIPFGRMTLESQVMLPLRLKRLGLDLIHFLSHGDAPAWGRVRTVVSVLDLIPLRFPDLYKADKPNWRYRLARFLELRAIALSGGIIAISEATKRDLMSILGIPESQIVVTPLAVGSEFSPEAEDAKTNLRNELGIPPERPLLLYVGGIDPRKNVFFMLEALSELCKQGRHSPLLCMVGTYEKDRHYQKLLSTMNTMGLEKNVLLRGFVPDNLLPKVYQSADIALFPSLYEGFGFPVLEAMASGVPVIAGNNSSLPEVVGDEYPLLPDNDQAMWVRALDELLTNQDTRRALRALGLKRAQLFSWEKTGKLTVEAYQYFARRG